MKHLMLFEDFANESASKPFTLRLTIISDDVKEDILENVESLLIGIGCENVQSYHEEPTDTDDVQQVYTFEGDCADVKQFSTIKNDIETIFLKYYKRRADDMNINGVDLR